MRGKNHLRHWNARRKAFLRSAKNDRDLIGAIEAQPLAGKCSQPKREREQHHVHHDQPAERLQGDRVPDAFIHRFAERDVHHQQDGTLIDETQNSTILLNPFADHRPQQLPGNKRHEQLQHNIADRVPCRTRVAAAVRHYQADQRGGDEDAEQARRRGGADRRRDITFGDGSERNGRLHSGGQRAKKQDAHIQRGRDERR